MLVFVGLWACGQRGENADKKADNMHAMNDAESGPLGAKSPARATPGNTIEHKTAPKDVGVKSNVKSDSAAKESERLNSELRRLLAAIDKNQGQGTSGNGSGAPGGPGSGDGAAGGTGGSGGTSYYRYNLKHAKIVHDGSSYHMPGEMEGTIACRVVVSCTDSLELVAVGVSGTSFAGSSAEMRRIVYKFMLGCKILRRGDVCPETGYLYIKGRQQ